MTSRSQVVLASKRAEAWLEFVDTVAALGRLARIDPAVELLHVLQDECSRYGDTLEASLSTSRTGWAQFCAGRAGRRSVDRTRRWTGFILVSPMDCVSVYCADTRCPFSLQCGIKAGI